MTHVYDALMDRLAALAVEAVQDPEAAVQAYWLSVVAHQETPPAAGLTLGALRQRALQDSACSLPAWARPLAALALERLVRDGVWLTCSSQAVVDWPAAHRPYVDDILDQADRVWQAAGALYGACPPALQAVPQEVRRGVVLFEAGLYFACHEYFETLWGRTEDAASALYQGIIQIAVAMRHLESHNVRGAMLLLRAGMGRLQRYPAVYRGLHLASWLQRLEALLAHLVSLPGPAAYCFDPAQVPPLVSLES